MENIKTIDALENELLRGRFKEIVRYFETHSSTDLRSLMVEMRAAYVLNRVSAPEVLWRITRQLEDVGPGDADVILLAELGVDMAIALRMQEVGNRLLDNCCALSGGKAEPWLQMRLLLAFDDRQAAKALLPTLRSGHRMDTLAAANLAYIEGDFESALLHLELLTRGDFDKAQMSALKLSAQIFGALRRFDEEAVSLSILIDNMQGSDNIDYLRLDLAAAYAAKGTDDGVLKAEAVLKTVSNGNGDLASYANRRLSYLEKSRNALMDGQSPRHARLFFPTVHQKHNYCGPAVLELCLRSLGIELTQDEIAGVVKRETGTPMYEICAYLNERDIEAIRTSATLDRLRGAIDLGFPIIVQEEYSVTNHVAVLTGYDDRLGLFTIQDPMTHRAELKSYEWVENSGQLFGNGIVVVVGRRSQITDELREALVKAELENEAAFAILDEADRMRASAKGQGTEAAVADEVIAASNLALDKNPDYQLAWCRRAWAQVARYRQDRDNRDTAWRAVHAARVRWRGCEWPHQVHARVLSMEGRWRESFVESLAAHRCDPDDGNNLSDMAYALGLLGDVRDGVMYAERALCVMPDHPWVIAELVVQYIQALAEISGSKWEDLDNLGWIEIPENRPCAQSLEIEMDELQRRISFYLSLALEKQPDSPILLQASARLSAINEEWNTAIDMFEKLIEVHEDSWQVRVQQLRLAWYAEDTKRADAVVDILRKKHADVSQSWLAIAQHLREDEEAAYRCLVEGVGAVGVDRHELVDSLWDAALAFGGGSEAAAVLMSDLAHEHDGDPAFVREVAGRVDRAGQRGLAVELFRQVVLNEPGDVKAKYRLGDLLADDPLTRDEGREQLQEVLQMVPSSNVVRVRLAWCLFDSPNEGLALLEPCLETGDPHVYDAASALQSAIGNHAEAEKLRRLALGCYPTLHDARVELGRQHVWNDRYDLALSVLRPLVEEPFNGTGDVDEAEDAVMTAFRLAGRVQDISDWVKKRCEAGVPKHLAFDIYYGYRSIDRALAAQAALVYAEHADKPGDALEWEVNAAGCEAKLGNFERLEQVVCRLNGERDLPVEAWIDAWQSVYHAMVDLDRYDDAQKAVEAMVALAPDYSATLASLENWNRRNGDYGAALDAAVKLRERYPYQHMGDERLGILFGMAGEAGKALVHAARAIRIAPYCHISHASAAHAHFAAGNIEQARIHIERYESLEETTHPEEWDESTALLHALRGDTELLEQCLAHRLKRIDVFQYKNFDARLREVAQVSG